ncbi:MAG: zinc metalloprotease HtpX [Euryarchaeota archaeon]|nr:zinc metalloprotease HtpX [Euryarchaeota archaeon]
MGSLAELKGTMVLTVTLVFGLLAAVLAAILFFIGASVIFAIFLTFLFVLFQWAVGPFIIRASTGLRYLEPSENPWLESTVKELALKSGVPMPRLAIVPAPSLNAFVFGRTTSGMTLALHQGLLEKLTQSEIRGVIGHELGHIKHRDVIIMTILSAIPLICYIIARGIFWSGRGRSRREKGAGAVVLAAIVAYFAYLISQLLIMKFSRLREHYADTYSAYLTASPRGLESALTKIAYGLSLEPEEPHGARAFYISDPVLAKAEVGAILERKQEYDLDKDGVLDEKELQLAMEQEAKSTWKNINSWFSTHPPTFRRIILLRQIENEMKVSKYVTDIYKYI